MATSKKAASQKASYELDAESTSKLIAAVSALKSSLLNAKKKKHTILSKKVKIDIDAKTTKQFSDLLEKKPTVVTALMACYSGTKKKDTK